MTVSLAGGLVELNLTFSLKYLLGIWVQEEGQVFFYLTGLVREAKCTALWTFASWRAQLGQSWTSVLGTEVSSRFCSQAHGLLF